MQRIAEFRAATERRRQERELEIPAGESEAGDPVEQHEWKVRHWVLAFLVPLVFFLAASGWASPRNKNDQGFLNAVIGLQALFGGLLIRTLAALFHWESALAFVGKVLAIVVLGVALSGLTMCSYLATHPWGF